MGDWMKFVNKWEKMIHNKTNEEYANGIGARESRNEQTEDVLYTNTFKKLKMQRLLNGLNTEEQDRNGVQHPSVVLNAT